MLAEPWVVVPKTAKSVLDVRTAARPLSARPISSQR
jgi:hypothetical protein